MCSTSDQGPGSSHHFSKHEIFFKHLFGICSSFPSHSGMTPPKQNCTKLAGKKKGYNSEWADSPSSLYQRGVTFYTLHKFRHRFPSEKRIKRKSEGTKVPGVQTAVLFSLLTSEVKAATEALFTNKNSPRGRGSCWSSRLVKIRNTLFHQSSSFEEAVTRCSETMAEGSSQQLWNDLAERECWSLQPCATQASCAFCLDGISWYDCKRGAANNAHEEKTFVRISQTLSSKPSSQCANGIPSPRRDARHEWRFGFIGRCSEADAPGLPQLNTSKHVQKCYTKAIMDVATKVACSFPIRSLQRRSARDIPCWKRMTELWLHTDVRWEKSPLRFQIMFFSCS